MNAEHTYSTFALDLYWAESSRDPAVTDHVAACDRCRGYLEQLSAMDARPLALPVRNRTRWRFFAAFAFAVAVAIIFVVWRRDTTAPSARPPTYVATKSAPAVQVLLRRDGELRVWNGTEPVRDRDTLALRIACESMAHVTVLVRDRDRWTETFDNACVDEVLPFTLVVDDQPGDERIAVVLSHGALDRASLSRAVDLRTQSADVWALQFVFTKEVKK